MFQRVTSPFGLRPARSAPTACRYCSADERAFIDRRGCSAAILRPSLQVFSQSDARDSRARVLLMIRAPNSWRASLGDLGLGQAGAHRAASLTPRGGHVDPSCGRSAVGCRRRDHPELVAPASRREPTSPRPTCRLHRVRDVEAAGDLEIDAVRNVEPR